MAQDGYPYTRLIKDAHESLFFAYRADRAS